MPDNTPFNPFERPAEVVDPRNSKLFASPQDSGFGAQPSRETIPTRKPGSSLPVMSARRELRLKNSEIRRNILIGVSIVIGLVLALIATDTIKLGTGPKPSLSKTKESASSFRNRPAIVAGKQLETIRELSGEKPLRVYIGGDSLAGSFGSPLATNLGESGVIKATYDSRPSSGLVNSGFFNWNTHAKKIVSKYDPEVFIFIIGTNDASIVSANPKGYVESYTKKLNSFLDIVSPEKMKVIFVLAPAMKEKALNRNLNKLNDVIYSVAVDREALIVESSNALSPSGTFTTNLKVGSKTKTIRSTDGVHIAKDGAILLANFVQDFMNKTFGIDRYLDAPAIKPLKVPGCCSSPTNVPSGTSSKGSSASSTTSTSTPSSTTSTTFSETVTSTTDGSITP